MGRKDTSKPGVVYVVTDRREPDRVRYVGKTVRGVKVRERKHWSESKRARNAFPNWLRSREHRKEDIEFTAISKHPNVAELNEAEVQAIAKYRAVGQADLNLTDGGDGSSPGQKWGKNRKENHYRSVGRGDNHYNSKLTEKIVSEIREKSTQQYVPAQEFADKYSVSIATISSVLRNELWRDVDYDPDLRVTRGWGGDESRNKKLTRKKVDEIRDLRKREYHTNSSIGERYGVGKDMVSLILRNKNWYDPEYDPTLLKRK